VLSLLTVAANLLVLPTAVSGYQKMTQQMKNLLNPGKAKASTRI